MRPHSVEVSWGVSLLAQERIPEKGFFGVCGNTRRTCYGRRSLTHLRSFPGHQAREAGARDLSLFCLMYLLPFDARPIRGWRPPLAGYCLSCRKTLKAKALSGGGRRSLTHLCHSGLKKRACLGSASYSGSPRGGQRMYWFRTRITRVSSRRGPNRRLILC